MAFSTDYPYITQWVTYQGKMTVTQVNENIIEVALADAGGAPDDGRFHGASVEDALSKANEALPHWLNETKNLGSIWISGS